MANSVNHFSDSRVIRRCCTLLAVSLLGLSNLAEAAISQSIGTINFKAESLQGDLARNELLMQQVVINQGGYEIRAAQARASGIDFRNSEWVFTDSVRITTPTGTINAAQAIVSFSRETISQLRITGTPAVFQNNLSGKQQAQGQAKHIDYDVTSQQIRLSDSAWFKYGQVEYRGQSVVYDLTHNRIIADRNEQQGERLQITVTPEQGSSTSGSPTP